MKCFQTGKVRVSSYIHSSVDVYRPGGIMTPEEVSCSSQKHHSNSGRHSYSGGPYLGVPSISKLQQLGGLQNETFFIKEAMP